ncbi:MAG: catalase [Limnobacter sp.]|uniref:catalase n=1 Tax=Limnobacter sp. TaxID=2003368 RepID=UPI0030029D93
MRTAIGMAVVAALAAIGTQAAVAQTPIPSEPANAVNLVDGLEGVFGTHAARRSGARGVCAAGEFVGNKAASAISKASAFSGKPVPVTLRFSVGGGNPNAPENGKGVRGLAAQFDLPNSICPMVNNG